MVRERVRRLANPRKRRIKARKKRRSLTTRNSKGQFVRKGRKRRATAKKSRARAANPKRRKVSAVRRRRTTKAVRRRRRKVNPAFLVTLGSINPRKSRKKRRTVTVARKRRRKSANPRRRRRANTRRVVVVAPRRRRRVARRRRANPVYHRRRRRVHSRRRRNPAVFGSKVGSVASVEMILGGLLGVTAAKMIPTFLPAGFISSPIMRILATGASAFVASMVAGKILPSKSHFGSAVLFGGLMQTGSVALNAFLPSIGGQIGLNGMGDLVSGTQFTVPQNPLRYVPAPAPQAPRVTMNGLNRAFGTAF